MKTIKRALMQLFHKLIQALERIQECLDQYEIAILTYDPFLIQDPGHFPDILNNARIFSLSGSIILHIFPLFSLSDKEHANYYP